MPHPFTFVLKKTIFKKKLKQINNSIDLYNSNLSKNQIVQIQLKKFNLLWEKIQTENPFYILWKEENKLPRKIFSIKEISEFPILNKEIINDRKDLILKKKFSRTTYTGGTSGITTVFPTNNIESFNAYVTAYTGRMWWGIKPLSDILMLWGHSHLFESGYKGYLQKFLRKIKDGMINTCRISSYDLSENNLIKFFDIINKRNPPTIISYSGNIFKLAKYMDENNLSFIFGKIKNIIITSETLFEKDVKLVKKKIAHNVINEYGMAETGVIGYSRQNTQDINIFWNNFIVTHNENNNLFLNTLTSRAFPLINYDTEDKIEPLLIKNSSILKIKQILGKTRNNLPIKLLNGTIVIISTIFFDHILKYLPHIYSVQYLIEDDIITIILNTNKIVDIEKIRIKCINTIAENFGLPDESKIKIKIYKSSKTIAGKHSVFV